MGWTRPQRVVLADASSPFGLDNGASLNAVEVEFETYGELNPQRSNAIMVMHALSGDAHVAGWDASWQDYQRPWREKAPGWWDNFVGPGKPLNTERYFVICANVLGSCYGTTGPTSTNPATGSPYRLSFPVVSVGDWVRLHVRLLEYLDIRQLLAVVGGSLGGQQALEFSLAFPERLKGALVLAASPHLSTQGLAFNAVARHAILSDPQWCGGAYDPVSGLWTLGTMASGTVHTLAITNTVNAGTAARTVTNVASVSASNPDPAPGNNQDQATFQVRTDIAQAGIYFLCNLLAIQALAIQGQHEDHDGQWQDGTHRYPQKDILLQAHRNPDNKYEAWIVPRGATNMAALKAA